MNKLTTAVRNWKAERDVKKLLKAYWRGELPHSLDDTIGKILDLRIEIGFRKKELKATRRKLRESTYKAFWVEHICCFVISDTGQIIYRGRPLPSFLMWVKSNVIVTWLRLTGTLNRNQMLVRKRFHLYAGCKTAALKSGITEAMLLKTEKDILGR